LFLFFRLLPILFLLFCSFLSLFGHLCLPLERTWVLIALLDLAQALGTSANPRRLRSGLEPVATNGEKGVDRSYSNSRAISIASTSAARIWKLGKMGHCPNLRLIITTLRHHQPGNTVPNRLGAFRWGDFFQGQAGEQRWQ